MSWSTRFAEERQAAEHAFGAAAGTISSGLATFTSWLMAASGAAFALLLTHLEKLSPHLDTRSFRWSLVWFAISLLGGLLSKWLSTSVSSTLSVIAAIEERAERVGPIEHFNALAFTKFLADSSLRGYRCFIWRGYRHSKSANSHLAVSSAVRLSQAQSLLVLAQVAFLVIAVLVLAHGVKT